MINKTITKLILAYTLLALVSSCSKKESTESSGAFVSTWQVAADDLSVTLPLIAEGSYLFVVDWGDGTPKQTATQKSDARHTYATAGTYTISITGTIEGFAFGNGLAYMPDYRNGGTVTPPNPEAKKIRTISSWGPLKLGATNGQFAYAENLAITATDASGLLSKTTDLSWAFFKATKFNSDISNWDMSNIEDTHEMFDMATTFNQDLSKWDVSSVTNMGSMFYGASVFNQDLSKWDVSKATNMVNMFSSATVFNQDLSGWEVDNVISNSNFADKSGIDKDASKLPKFRQ